MCENTSTCFYDTVNEVCSPKGTVPTEPCEPCSECNGEETRCENTPTCSYDTINEVCSPKVDECDPEWATFGSSCYKPFPEKLTFDAAEDKCVSEGGHVSSIHSGEENAFVFELGGGTDLWIGAKWTGNEWEWEDKSSWGYTNWWFGEPNDPNKEPCIALWTDRESKWNDVWCTLTYSFVCKKDDGTVPTEPCEPCSECNGEETRCENTPTCLYDTVNEVCSPKDDGDCPDGWLMYEGKCYGHPKDKKLSWADAESYCQSWSPGAHLASIRSAEEQKFVQVNFPGNIWLGGSDTAKEGTWTWSDGASWIYSDR